MRLAAIATVVLVIVGLIGLAREAGAIELGAITIRDGSNRTVGRVDSDGTIRNASNSAVGRVEQDGTIRNGANSAIGKVESDGTIRNGSNSAVGKVEGYAPRLRHLVAAVLFFGGSVSVLER